MTSQEFNAFMTTVIQKTLECKQRRPDVYEVGPFLSMDNATWHAAGNLKVEGNKTVKDCKLPLPAMSPDLHKIIEHVNNRVKSAFAKKLAEDPRKYSADELRAMFEECFFAQDINGSKIIDADIHSLKQTMEVVSRSRKEGGTEGDHAPPGLN